MARDKMKFVEKLRYVTDDGQEFATIGGAELHCLTEDLIGQLEDEALMDPVDARIAAEYIITKYNIEPKEYLCG